MIQHPPNGFKQMRGMGVCRKIVGLGGGLRGTVPGLDQDPARPDGARHPDVGPAIANHDRPVERQAQVRRRLVEHAGPGLAALARLAIHEQRRVRQVRTIVVPSQCGIRLRALPLQIREGIMHDMLVDHPARDPRLVRHDHNGEPSPLQQPYSLDAPRVQAQPLESIDVSDVLDQSAVTVEEDGRDRHGRCRLGRDLERDATTGWVDRLRTGLPGMELHDPARGRQGNG